MDPNRFDRLSKSIAKRLTRRQMLGGLGAGGLAASVLKEDGSRAADTGAVTCIYDFDGTIDLGPSSTLPSSNQISGELTLTIESDGSINSAKLDLPGGQTWRVVGQATGRAINLRFSVPNTGAFIAVGTGRNDVANCTSAMSGPASGPKRRDAGSWSASLKSSSGAAPAASATPTQAAAATVAVVNPVVAPTQESTIEPTAAATPSCDLECGADTLGLDAENCVCLCPSGQTNCTFEIGSIPAKGGVIFRTVPLTKPRGFCIDLTSDISNCGACSAMCIGSAGVAATTCQNGVCNYQCASGYITCANDAPCATNVQTSCGSGNSMGSDCTCICAAGLTSCGPYCANTQTDVNNCGGCGKTCGPVVSECSAGSCHPLVKGAG